MTPKQLQILANLFDKRHQDLKEKKDEVMRKINEEFKTIKPSSKISQKTLLQLKQEAIGKQQKVFATAVNDLNKVCRRVIGKNPVCMTNEMQNHLS